MSPTAMRLFRSWVTDEILWVVPLVDLVSLCAAAGARVTDTWTPAVTHVVCHTNENRQAKRTHKYLQGVLGGNWIVTSDWVTACLQQGGAAAEEGYEVPGDTAGCVGGPSRGRQRATKGGKELLAGCHVFLAGGFRAFVMVLGLGFRLMSSSQASSVHCWLKLRDGRIMLLVALDAMYGNVLHFEIGACNETNTSIIGLLGQTDQTQHRLI